MRNRTIAVAAGLVVASITMAAPARAQLLEYAYAGCNALATCATATLFVDALTRDAVSVVADLRWTDDAPGALAGPSTASFTVAGASGGWERGGASVCEYPTGFPRTSCRATFQPVFTVRVAPDFQPTTMTMLVGYGVTESLFPASTAPLTLTAVPEPTTAVLLGGGLLGLALLARRRRSDVA